MTAAPLQQQPSHTQVWGAPEEHVQSSSLSGTKLQAQLGQALQAAGCGQVKALQCARQPQHVSRRAALGAVQLGGHNTVKTQQAADVTHDSAPLGTADAVEHGSTLNLTGTQQQAHHQAALGAAQLGGRNICVELVVPGWVQPDAVIVEPVLAVVTGQHGA